MSSPDYDHDHLTQVSRPGFNFWVTRRFKQHDIERAYEEFSVDLFVSQLSSNSIVVDVGAHYGYYTLWAASRAPAGQVISIEPVAENFRLLRRNLDLNSLTNTETYNVAVSDSDGEVSFNVAEASDSSGIITHPLTKTVETRVLPSRSLDSLIGQRHIDLMKIDTEGHELQVLAGARGTLQANPEMRMLIEFNPKCLRAADREPEALLQEITDLGFEIFLCHDGRRRFCRLREEKLSGWRDIIGEHEYINLWCVPKQRSLLVAFVSHSSALQGAERSLLEIVKGLSSQGTLCHVALPNQGPLTEALRALPVSISIYGERWPLSTVSALPPMERRTQIGRASAALAETLLSVNPHVVVSNTSVILMGALAAAALKLPHVWDIREFDESGIQYLDRIEARSGIYARLSNHVLFNSEFTRQRYPLISGPATVAYPIVEVPAWEPIDLFTAGRIAFLLPGAIREQKGQKDAVLAMAEVVKERQDVELVILGSVNSDEYVAELKTIIEEARLEEYVRFAPFTANPYAAMAAADVVLFCSRNEPFGRVPVEAMLLGRPVLAADSGGVKESVVAGEGGLLYRAGDPADLARVMLQLAESPELRGQLAERAGQSVRSRFKNEQTLCSLQRLFNDLKQQAVKEHDLLTEYLLAALRGAAGLIAELNLQALAGAQSLKLAQDKLSGVETALAEANRKMAGLTGELKVERARLAGMQADAARQLALIQSQKGTLNRKAVRLALRIAESRLFQNRIARWVKNTIYLCLS